jgi:hypothetical protein
MMRPRHSTDPNLLAAYETLARAIVALRLTREHIEQSLEACRRSHRLLRATVPVLPYRPDEPDDRNKPAPREGES